MIYDKLIKKTLFICFLIFFLCLVCVKIFNSKDISSIEVDFYYNHSIVYTDTGRTVSNILNGYYDAKNTYYYKDIKDFGLLNELLKQRAEIIHDEKLKRMYESFVDSLCVVRLNGNQILEYTYSESNDDYCLCNKNLIRRNKVYDSFAKYLIKKILFGRHLL